VLDVEKIYEASSMLDRDWENIQIGQRRVGVEARKDDSYAASLVVKYTRNSTTLLALRQNQSERISWMEDLLYIAKRYQWRDSEAFALNGLGIIYEDMGERKRAMENYQMTLDFSRESKDRLLEARTLGNLGWAHIGAGEDVEYGI